MGNVRHRGVIKSMSKSELTESKVKKALDWAYDKAVYGGLPGIDTAEELALSYTIPNSDIVDNVNSLIRWQNAKSTTSGFLSGLGGLMVLPISLPANFTSVVFIQIRMVAAIAHMAGYDLKNDKVRTMVYLVLCGTAIKDILKNTGIQFGNKITKSFIEKNLTREIIKKINKAVGFRFITKNGEKGLINAMKLVPIVGGIIGGGIDLLSTNTIGNRARDIFILQKL